MQKMFSFAIIFDSHELDFHLSLMQSFIRSVKCEKVLENEHTMTCHIENMLPYF
jgi:hypothetical protein